MTAKTSAGVKAIIFLQAFAGIKETRKKALAGWQAMTASMKATTMRTYKLLNTKV